MPDVKLRWRTSSYSGNCVEVAVSRAVYVHDTKDREGGTQLFEAAAWSAFLADLRQRVLVVGVRRRPASDLRRGPGLDPQC